MITDPSEEYFKDGLWGWASSAWTKLVATAGGLLKVQFGGQDADVEVTQTDAEDLQVAPHGWRGSSWYKQPLVFGYSDDYYQPLSELNVSSGNQSLYSSTVPSGELWVVTNVACRANTNPPSAVRLRVTGTANLHDLFYRGYTTAPYTLEWTGKAVLSPGAQLLIVFAACAGGEDLYVYIHGYKMKIAE